MDINENRNSMSFSTILESDVDESYHHGYPLYLANNETDNQDRTIGQIEHEDLIPVRESTIEDKGVSDMETDPGDDISGSTSDQDDEDE
jgi:hypothetical protein